MVLWLLKRFNKATLPPGPRGLPIVGYFPFLSTHLHKSFTELAEVYGPIYKLWLGYKMHVVISSPSLVKQIRDQDETFAARDPSIAAKILTHGVNDVAFKSYGSDWKKWRKLRKVFVHELLSNARLEGSYVLRKKEVERAVKDVYRKRGKALDFGQLVFMTVSNTILSMLWGCTVYGEEGEMFFSKIRNLVDEFTVLQSTPNISDLIPPLARFDLQGIERKTRQAQQSFDQILSSVIDERRKLISDAVDFLDLLRRKRDRKLMIGEEKLNDIVVGGTDTTSTTIEWAMSELTLHPQSMQKAQLELAQVIKPNNLVEESDIPNLPFLHAIIKETLRLHPVAPLLLPRSPTESCHVGGYTIPQGAKVFLNVWAIHRNPEYWNNPTSFNPDRFLEEDLDYLGNNFHYLPFGSGRRICAGLPLGEKMVMYVLATFLHMFDWEVPEGVVADSKEKFGVVLEKATPLVLVPSPRLLDSSLYR
ncbi:Labd-13Z-ene-9,15,16-triol synthase, chloroplastic [Linum perenne]